MDESRQNVVLFQKFLSYENVTTFLRFLLQDRVRLHAWNLPEPKEQGYGLGGKSRMNVIMFRKKLKKGVENINREIYQKLQTVNVRPEFRIPILSEESDQSLMPSVGIDSDVLYIYTRMLIYACQPNIVIRRVDHQQFHDPLQLNHRSPPVIIPWNVGNFHWQLAILKRTNEGKLLVHFYDSIRCGKEYALGQVRQILAAAHIPDESYNVFFANDPIQKGGTNDCGVYDLWFIRRWLGMDAGRPEYFRQHIRKELRAQCLLPIS